MKIPKNENFLGGNAKTKGVVADPPLQWRKGFKWEFKFEEFPNKINTPTQVAVPVSQEIAEEKTPDVEVSTTQDSNHIIIKSPIIGTFYRKPSPDKPSFVEVGQNIVEGDVLCVIEAMKLFNEIESEVSGKIVKILVDDQNPVEFDQPLFIIDPS